MAWVKALHLLAVFMWIGTLLSLTRLMGYHVKEDVETQKRLVRIYRRMYLLVQLPSMIVVIVLGLVLIAKLNLDYKPGWFHMKLTFVTGLVLCDIACYRCIVGLQAATDHGRGVKYKILHGVTGLVLMGIIVSIAVVRDKPGEVLATAEQYDGKTIGKNRL